MSLTHFDIENAKPESKPCKLSDGGGLFLPVQSNGGKLWRPKYRRRGTERSLSFGPFPVVSIAGAHVKRDEAKKLIGDAVITIAKRSSIRTPSGLPRS
jgi:hypothetical protein